MSESKRLRHYFDAGIWLWESPGDRLPFWLSDEDGYEISAHPTLEEAAQAAQDLCREGGHLPEYRNAEAA